MTASLGSPSVGLRRRFFQLSLGLLLLALAGGSAHAQRRMENLGRGVVAVRSSATEVFVSWRLLGFEPQDIPFNVYRSEAGGAPVRLNSTPLAGGTNFVDTNANPAVSNAYSVRPIVQGVELAASAAYALPANAPVRPYLSLPLQPTAWSTYVHLLWVGDLDGDGEFDFVVSRMPNVAGQPQLIDAYKRDGTFLWRVDFGPNSFDPDNIEPVSAAINAGHNDGVTVYDLDCDGRAEVIIKSAHGVTFGNGQTLTYGDNVTQFISVLDGLTGAERARAPVPTDYIADGPVAGHFGIAYLDGVKPSFIFKAKNRVGSGPFNLFVAAWDFDGTSLTQRWKWLRGNNNAPDYHQIRIVDVDGDGRDEICDGGYVLNSDGTMRYTLGAQGVIHGDRFHIGDLDPDRPGLEGFSIQQNNASGLLYFVYSAADGTMIHRHFGGIEDTARGTAGDVTAASRGYEYWSFHGIHEIRNGTVISPDPRRPWPNFRIWWDGDVLSENLNREFVEKWDPATGGVIRLLTASQDGSVDSWRDAAQFYGDILGDWREEVVYEKSDHTALLVYTTPVPTGTRLYTLPHNPEYRLCFTVKGYLQSNMLDYYLGDGMTAPPPPNIVPVLGGNSNVPVIVSFADDSGASPSDRVTNDNTPTLQGLAPAGAQILVSRIGGTGDDGMTTSSASGAWSFAYPTALPDGVHYFVARVNDGQNTLSYPFAITIDTAAPAAPAIDVVVSNGAGGLVLQGTAAAGLRVAAAIDGVGSVGAVTADASGRWSITHAPSLAPASYTVSATTTDEAGNTSAATQRVVDLATTTPVISAVSDDTGVSATDRVTADPTLVLSGTAASGADVTVYLFGTGVIGSTVADAGGAWTFAYGATLADGTYGFTAHAGSSAGAAPVSVVIDGAAPSVLGIERVVPSVATSSSSTVTFRVTFGEAVAGVDASDFTPVFGGGLSGPVASVAPAGDSAYDVTLNPLSGEGTVRLDLNASGTGITDIAGNALAGGYAAGPVFTRVLLGDGVWTRTATDGAWSDNANWLGGIVAHGVGTTADFSTLEIPDDVVVHLDAPRTVSRILFGDEDTTSAASWTIDANGNPANLLTLATGASAPTITVNPLGAGARATIAAPMAGTSGFNKAGAGTLVLAGSSSLTGTVTINTGVVRVEAGGRLTPGTVNMSGFGNAFTTAGGTVEATGTANVNSGANLIVDSGLASFPAIAASNNTGNAVRVNGGRLVAGSISFQRSTDGGLNYNTGFIVKGGEAQVGTITLGTNNSNAMMSVEGGEVTVTGALTLGNQSSGGRGGHLRVTGGTFNSTDSSAAGGLIVSRRNNNASTTHFLGGVSAVERIVLGFDGLTAGSGTLNVNGGVLYVGAGGIIRNAGGTFAANVNLTSGLLGAKAGWSSALNMALGGNITLKAADVADAPFNVTLGGVLSGAGSLTKSGAGTLTLGAANTFTGNVTVNAGTLRVAGSLGGGGLVEVNAGGVLAGDGPIAKPISLNSGGTLSPDGTTSIATLAANTVTWNGGASLAVDLGASGVSDQLALSGALEKGSAGAYAIALNATAPLAPGSQYTVATFAASSLQANEITATGLPDGFAARPVVTASDLRLVIVARPVIESSPVATGTFGAPFSYTIVAANGPTSFSASGLPPGLSLDPTTGVIAGTPGAAGAFQVVLGATNEAGTGSVTLHLTVAKAVAPVAVGTPGNTTVTLAYNGMPRTASVTTEPAGLNATYTYNGNSEPPTLPGTYDVVATIDDPNYEGTATGRLIITIGALVRHAPVLNGELDGSIQVLLPEGTTLNGGAMISGDLLVPGSPNVLLNGSPTYGGTLDAGGAASPADFTITLNGGSVLRHVVRRVDAIAVTTVAPPPQPPGTRSVVLNRSTDAVGDFATVRHLTVNGNVGPVAVPPGTYASLTVNGGSELVLGVAGATEPAVYNVQALTLNGEAPLRIAGPVVVTLAYGIKVNGRVGDAGHPGWLELRVASGGVWLNGSAQLYGLVVTPSGTVSLNGSCTLTGRVVADRLTINGGGVLVEVP